MIGSKSGVQRTVQFDFAGNCQSRQKFDRFLHEFVEFEFLQFEGRLSQQATHPPNDFAGTPVIVDNIVNDIFELSDIGAGRCQYRLGRFSIRENCPKRLIDFVGDRGGEFASR